MMFILDAAQEGADGIDLAFSSQARPILGAKGAGMGFMGISPSVGVALDI